MSLARRHRDMHAALAAAALAVAAAPAGEDPVVDPEVNTPASQIALRLTEDLRTLHGIQAVEKKIEAKRAMLPEYEAWIDGLLQAGHQGMGVADVVLPTVMVWRIDVGDIAGALPLARHMLEHDLPMPERYKRAPAAIVVEMVAEAALSPVAKPGEVPLEQLLEVDQLAAGHDMHDQVTAKLKKAIGREALRLAEAAEVDQVEPPVIRALWSQAVDALKAALGLNAQSGVKKDIEKAERGLKAVTPEVAETPAG